MAEIDNGKSLERAGSVTGEVVLCSGLVDDGRDHRFIAGNTWNLILSLSPSTPRHWAYSRNILSSTPDRTSEFVGSTKEPTRGLPNTSPEKQTS